MLVKYNACEKADVVLNDLIKINNDRIARYTQILDKTKYIDGDLEITFLSIIEDSRRNIGQLLEKLEGNPVKATDSTCMISGMIHKAWADLKGVFVGSTRKAIIMFSEYNEQLVQHAYKAALSVSDELNMDVREMIEEQQNDLQKAFEGITKCHISIHPLNTGLLYFN